MKALGNMLWACIFKCCHWQQRCWCCSWSVGLLAGKSNRSDQTAFLFSVLVHYNHIFILTIYQLYTGHETPPLVAEILSYVSHFITYKGLLCKSISLLLLLDWMLPISVLLVLHFESYRKEEDLNPVTYSILRICSLTHGYNTWLVLKDVH